MIFWLQRMWFMNVVSKQEMTPQKLTSSSRISHKSAQEAQCLHPLALEEFQSRSEVVGGRMLTTSVGKSVGLDWNEPSYMYAYIFQRKQFLLMVAYSWHSSQSLRDEWLFLQCCHFFWACSYGGHHELKAFCSTKILFWKICVRNWFLNNLIMPSTSVKYLVSELHSVMFSF